MESGSSVAYTVFECKVVGLFPKTYGKMPDSDSDKQIMMEYEFYTDMLANSTSFNETAVDMETQ